ncbi:MAG TPA: hypothetical protein VG894_07525 [Bauldia sp.]|nr:hypothetical protein [Bauldia sp.]
MLTLLVFFALALAAAVIAGLASRTPALRHALDAAAWIARAPTAGLSRGVGWLANRVLGTRADGDLAGWRLAGWALVSLIPMAAFASLAHWPVLPPAADPVWLLVLGVLLPVFSIGAAYLVVRDDFDAMEGVESTRRIRSGRAVASAPSVALALILIVAYVAAIAWWLSTRDSASFLTKAPASGSAATDALLVALRTLPTGYLLAVLDRVTGGDTAIAFAATLPAQLFSFLVRGVGAVVGLFVLAIAAQHVWQLRRIVDEIAERDERDERRADLIARAIAAPPSIKRGILDAATTRADLERQKRLIVAAKEIGLYALPETFCRRVESFDTEIQSFGLDQCLEMFRHRSREFAAGPSGRSLAEATRVLVRGRLAVEPTKKLLRLMTSIVVIKRGVVEPGEAERTKIEAALKAELNKPRAKEDAALRGFLRDLQSALNGSQAGGRLMTVPERKPDLAAQRPKAPPAAAAPPADAGQEPARQTPLVVLTEADLMPEAEAADPDAPPDSPPPTVH